MWKSTRYEVSLLGKGRKKRKRERVVIVDMIVDIV